MNKAVLLTLATLTSLLASCATGGAPLVGQYASGDDTRALQERRNRTTLTHSELDQHRRQRQDVSEEMDLDEKKRRSRLAPLRTASEAMNLIGGFGRFY